MRDLLISFQTRLTVVRYPLSSEETSVRLLASACVLDSMALVADPTE